MNFREYIFAEPYFGWLCTGVQVTLLITAMTTVISLLLGVAVAMFATSSSRSGRIGAKIYVSLFRNLPPIPLLLFLVFALPGVFLSLTGHRFPTGMGFPLLVLGLSLNTSAYVAEIFRSGVQALPAEHALAAPRLAGLREVGSEEHVCRDACEASLRTFEVLEHGVAPHSLAGPGLVARLRPRVRAGGGEVDQAVGLLHRERPEEHLIEE
ncbi:MAG: ABC transporter permease subunit [Planctomycetes bacterium]|nr:ABC transporter permease subunit [Planctomycetota bacterium]